jgi:hypothetical protein
MTRQLRWQTPPIRSTETLRAAKVTFQSSAIREIDRSRGRKDRSPSDARLWRPIYAPDRATWNGDYVECRATIAALRRLSILELLSATAKSASIGMLGALQRAFAGNPIQPTA